MSNQSNSNATTHSGVDASCDTLSSCSSCVQEGDCAWCAETRSCRQTGDACCLDMWTRECPEAELSCYRDAMQGSCAVCLSDKSVPCQWCALKEEGGGCVDGGGFCAFSSTGRSGRSLTCRVPHTGTCPSDRQDSTTYELSALIRDALIAVFVLVVVMCFCAPRIARRWRGRETGRRWQGRETGRARQQEAAMREVVVEARTMDIRALPNMRATMPGECSICLEEYAQGDLLLTLPCLHQYHKHCAERWLLEPSSDGACPMCKQPIG
jgi:hypothetical protein